MGWRWIFLINVPLGVAAVIAGLVVLPSGTARNTGPFDIVGFIGAMSTMVCVTSSAELLSSGGRTRTVFAALFFAMGLTIGWFTVRRMRRPGSLFSLEVFSRPTFRVSNISGGVYRVVITAVPFLLSLLFQIRFGWSATSAGVAVVALFLGNVAVKPLTTAIIRRWGFRSVLVWSAGSGCLVLLPLTAVSTDTPAAVFILLIFLSGVFRSVGFSAYNTLQFVDVPENDVANANILSATLQQAATSLGIAVAVISVQIGMVAAGLITGNTELGYQWAFAIVGLLFLIPVSGALMLDREAGNLATSVKARGVSSTEGR